MSISYAFHDFAPRVTELRGDGTSIVSSPHIDSSSLEMYVLKTISPIAEVEIENHLLVCHHCQNALESIITFVTEMKSALLSIGDCPGTSRADNLCSVAAQPRMAVLGGTPRVPKMTPSSSARSF